jgi:hypothetical protein
LLGGWGEVVISAGGSGGYYSGYFDAVADKDHSSIVLLDYTPV